MSKKTPNKGRQREKQATSREDQLASAQPASGESKGSLLTGEVSAPHSNAADGTRPSHEQIAFLAYHLWETHGRRAGTDRDDWFQAEQLLRAEGK